MARVLVVEPNMIWYDELKIVSYYSEGEIEDRIVQHAGQAFNGYFVLPFKLTISYNGDSAKPDLAFIRKDYKDWIVVEVELASHDDAHVKSQVEVFANGSYDAKKIAKYFKGKNNDIDEDLVRNLITTKQPPVMIIVDDPIAPWIPAFRSKKVSVCIFQVYKNTSGTELFRINGDYPYIYSEETHVIFPYKNTIRDIIKLQNPDVVAEMHGDEISLFYIGREMKGILIEDKGQKLIKISNLIIPPGKDLVLGRDINNRYILKLN